MSYWLWMMPYSTHWIKLTIRTLLSSSLIPWRSTLSKVFFGSEPPILSPPLFKSLTEAITSNISSALVLSHNRPQWLFRVSWNFNDGHATWLSASVRISNKLRCSIGSVKRSPPGPASQLTFIESGNLDIHIAIAIPAVNIAGVNWRFEMAMPQMSLTWSLIFSYRGNVSYGNNLSTISLTFFSLSTLLLSIPNNGTWGLYDRSKMRQITRYWFPATILISINFIRSWRTYCGNHSNTTFLGIFGPYFDPLRYLWLVWRKQASMSPSCRHMI